MGALLQKLLGGGPLLQLDHVECCNDEVRSSSSSDSCRTHASGHVETAREEAGTPHAPPAGLQNAASLKSPQCPGPSSSAPGPGSWASPSANLATRL